MLSVSTKKENEMDLHTGKHPCTLRPLGAALLLLAGLALGACNGTISSIGVPAASPWSSFTTEVLSPHDDLTVVTTGSHISASINATDSPALCNSDQGKYIVACSTPVSCGLAECQAGAPAGSTGVTFVSRETGYLLGISLDRPAFSAGGVELVSASAGTQGAIAVTVDSAAGLSVGAGFTSGLIPAPSTSATDPNGHTLQFDDAAALTMSPQWDAFGAGQLCSDGTSTSCNPAVSPDGVLAACIPDSSFSEGADTLIFRVDAPPNAYSLTCGSVPINLTINPTFASHGDCVSSLLAQHCGALKSQARAACNHAQQSVCRTLFP